MNEKAKTQSSDLKDVSHAEHQKAVPERVPCRRCKRKIDIQDAYCRFCGAKQEVSVAWYYRPIWIVLLTLLVLGPFALPLVWKSPCLSRPVKLAFTSVILAFTFVFCYGLYQLTHFMFGYYSQMGDQLEMMNRMNY